MPPTFSTLPMSVSSPVMARSALNGLPRAQLSSAEAIVTPADGPSYELFRSYFMMNRMRFHGVYHVFCLKIL